jgi:hypothetical protein
LITHVGDSEQLDASSIGQSVAIKDAAVMAAVKGDDLAGSQRNTPPESREIGKGGWATHLMLDTRREALCRSPTTSGLAEKCRVGVRD